MKSTQGAKAKQLLRSARRLFNVPRVRQDALSTQFSWLPSIELGETPSGVHMLWVSVFEHWLSREDACSLLENTPSEEIWRRRQLLKRFCEEMVSSTEVLSFAMRGHCKHRPVFRAFRSKEETSNYCKPNGSEMFHYPRRCGFRHRHFRVALPEFGCTFNESWDDTYHFYFTSPGIKEAALEWTRRSGVYILQAMK